MIRDAYRPTCSPDGKLIAFFGSGDAKSSEPTSTVWWSKPNGFVLSVAARNGSERKIFNREEDTYPIVRWMPDGRRFLTIKTVSNGAAADCLVKEWDVQTTKSKDIAKLHAEDVEKMEREDTFPFFRPLEVSADGKFLPIVVLEYKDSKSVLFTRIETMKVIDLRNGTVTTMCQLKNASGIDFSITK